MIALLGALQLADSLALAGYSVKLYELTAGDSSLGLRLYVLKDEDTLLALGDEKYPYLFVDSKTGQDVDGDGAPDLLVVLSGPSGSVLKAYSMTEAGPREVDFGLPPWAVPLSYEDVNGDGAPELVAVDVRPRGFKGWEVPPVKVIFKRSRGGVWEEAYEGYEDFYNSQLEELLKKLRMEPNPFKKKGIAAAYATVLLHMGKEAEAWQEFKRLAGADDQTLMELKAKILFWEPER